MNSLSAFAAQQLDSPWGLTHVGLRARVQRANWKGLILGGLVA